MAIIVATRDRAAMLERLLASARAMAAPSGARPALIVADDGSRDRTADVVAAATQVDPGVRYLPVAAGGKSRALNAAIRATTAPVLAFVDDDVTLDAGWLAAVQRHLGGTDTGAAQGAIRLPPAVTADPALAAEVERWGTIPCRDLAPTAHTSRSLTGANMLVLRTTFARVGLFDERLGPGAAGACEDTELALRIRAAGLAIGSIPDAVVYHAVERTRLGIAHLRAMHEHRGRSRIYYKRYTPSRVLPNLGVAALGVASTALAGSPRARARALGRWYHYRAMLAALRAPRLAGGVPRLEES
jgi:GT2 family glycosyltransferase